MAKQPEKKDGLEQEGTVPSENTAAEGVSERKPRSQRMLVLLSFAVLILFQVLVLFWVLPTPQKIKADIEEGKMIIDPPDEFRTPVHAVPKTGINPEELLEKTIGDPFKVQDPNPDNPGATDVFSVTVVLKIDKKDDKKFTKLLEEQPTTIRSIVYAVLRSSTLAERKQETLGAVRNKILTKMNEHFGSNYVKDVVCDNPSVTSM